MNDGLFGKVTFTLKGGQLVGRKSKSYPVGSRPGGLTIISSPDSGEKFVETFTCQHCNKIVDIKPYCSPSDVEFGGQCKGCMGLICLECYGKAECRPIEKWCEEQERKGRFRRDLSGI